jgi:hypothetical protein
MSTDYTHAYGPHATPEDGQCAMEWVSYLAGELHSDESACVSPVLRAFRTALIDGLDDGPRQRLRPYLARTIGTANNGLDEARSWMAIAWLIRVYTPAWLGLARLTDAAERLTSLPPVVDVADLQSALFALELARRDARAACTAALSAVRTAAWAAPWPRDDRPPARPRGALTAQRHGPPHEWRSGTSPATALAPRPGTRLPRPRGRHVQPPNARPRRRPRGPALTPTLNALQEVGVGAADLMLPTETLVTDDAPPLACAAPRSGLHARQTAEGQ